MTILEAIAIFSMGWSLRASLAGRFCFRCSARKMLLAAARKLIQKKDSTWRLRLAMMLVLAEPGVEILKVLGWKRIQGMVKNAGR